MRKRLGNLTVILHELKEGNTVFEEESSASFRMIDGHLVRFEGDSVFLGAQICIRSGHDYYCYADAPLKLEKGKLYKTRDSRKAFVSESIDNFCGCVENWDKIIEWDSDGKSLDGCEHTDLVSEWEDEE